MFALLAICVHEPSAFDAPGVTDVPAVDAGFVPQLSNVKL